MNDRFAAIAAAAALQPHGTRSRYAGGKCRCDECRKANTEYERERAKARRRGEWGGLVSATRARVHLIELGAAGVGRRTVADIAGVGETTLVLIKSGRKTQIRATNERAILRVTADATTGATLVPSEQVWRRLNELRELGFTKTELARHLGSTASQPALQLKTVLVTARTALRVERMYQRLKADLIRRLEVRVELAALSRREDEVESVLELRAERRREQRREYERTRRGAA